MACPGEILSEVDGERGALAEARELAVRVFGHGSTVRTQACVFEGYRGRVFDSASRVVVLVEGTTRHDAVRALVRVLEAMEPTS